MATLNVPRKFRSMNTFWKYYSGEAVAPYPTIFIGGNHEASNYLWELYYGGWAAPNIYFLGSAGVVKFGNLRIGGLSGIYKQPDFLKAGHFERPPCNGHTIRSVYHVREYDFHKLMQVEEPIDIFLSHDWPVGITDCGDWKELVREKPDFKQEVQERSLGSKPAAQLLELKPPYWFSAHLHCKFAARVQHGEDGSVTNFLALDKCLPGRKFLQHTFGILRQNLCCSFWNFLTFLITRRGSVEENSEDIPIDDVDELEEDAVDRENENS